MSVSLLPPRPHRVFLDSSGLLALTNVRDVYHRPAKAAWEQLSDEHWIAFTTNFVVAEAHALFLTRLSHYHAASFLRQLSQSSTTLLRVSARDEQRAREIIFQYADKDFSYTDATSFAVMERLRIGTALTLDRNLAQYGWTTLP